MLGQIDPASPFHQHVATLLDERLVRNPSGVPAPTPRGPRRFLTVGMATYDDYDGVYFSVQAIRLYHPEVTEQTEIIVVDNHPSGPCAKALKDLERQVSDIATCPRASSGDRRAGCGVPRGQRGVRAVHGLARAVPPGALARLMEYLAGPS